MKKACNERSRSGFTLVELLVAVSIVVVLSTIGLSTFSGIQSKARDATRKNDLRTLATALEIYYQTYGNYLTNTGLCADKTAGSVLYTNTNFTKFISGDLPKDPKDKNPYCYESPNGLTFKLYAKLEDGSDYILTSEDFIAQASPTPTSTSSPISTPAPTPTPAPTALPTATPTPTPSCVETTNTNCLPITVKVVKTSNPTPSPWPTCQYIAGGCKDASSTCVTDTSNCAVDPIRGDYTWCSNANYTLSCFPTDIPTNPPTQGVANIATYATCTAHLGSLGDSTVSRSGTTDTNGNIVLTVPVEIDPNSHQVNATCYVSISSTIVLYNVSRDWEYPNQFISPPIPQMTFGPSPTQTYNLTWYAGGGATYPKYVISGLGLNAIFVLQGP